MIGNLIYSRKIVPISLMLVVLIIINMGCRANDVKEKAEESPHQVIVVGINPPEEFDFLKKSDIYDIREKFINEYPLLLKTVYSGEYKPSEEVFGQVEDGKSWWGTLGIYHYGPGEKSIDGPSEESRFVCNPYIPVALCERWARGIQDPNLKPEAVFPEPVEIKWDISDKVVFVKYNVKDYLKKSGEVGDPRAKELKLIAYNARDLGYGYFYIYPDEAKNVSIANQNEALHIPQFLHTGNDSGYPGGSNNMSPGFPPLNVELKDLPARLMVGLWKEKPADLKAKPDIIEIMEIE